jgi:hypothetical protein
MYVFEQLISLLESLISLNHLIVIAVVEYIWSSYMGWGVIMKFAMEVKQEICGSLYSR